MRSLFAGSDGSGGASLSAGTAVDADIGIDGVNITLFDCTGRALALAGTTSYASIGRDFVSHNDSLFNNFAVQM